MSKHEKLISRLLTIPKDFTWDELATLMKRLGFRQVNKGATSGSRTAFVNDETKDVIRVHKPHPGKIIKLSALKATVAQLQDKDFI